MELTTSTAHQGCSTHLLPSSAKTTHKYQKTFGRATSFSTLPTAKIWFTLTTKSRFVGWKLRVPLAVYIVRDNNVGVAKCFRAIIPPPVDSLDLPLLMVSDAPPRGDPGDPGGGGGTTSMSVSARCRCGLKFSPCCYITSAIKVGHSDYSLYSIGRSQMINIR